MWSVKDMMAQHLGVLSMCAMNQRAARLEATNSPSFPPASLLCPSKRNKFPLFFLESAGETGSWDVV
jgi:hypothetical protein